MNVIAIKSPEQFVLGQIVLLKSGGPQMTVRSIDGSKVTTVWFTSEGTPHELAFHEHELSSK